MTPRISIIIPAYNAEAYLQRCLDSIVSQDFADCEVIVINDGSTDGTESLLERYPRVKVITQTNHGMATARNRGLDAATGDYVLFVDSDDRLCPNALATLAPHLGGEDIIGFGTRVFNEATETYTDNPIAAAASMAGWDYFNLHRLTPTPVHFVCIWQRAYRRKFLNEKSLRFVDGLRRAEDDLFTTMAMLHAGSVKTISDCLYTYHVRANSITRSANPALRDDAHRAQQMLVDCFIPLQGIDKSVIYRVLASNYIGYFSREAKALYGNRDRELARSIDWYQFRTVCITPRHRRLYRLARIHPALIRLYQSLISCRMLRK